MKYTTIICFALLLTFVFADKIQKEVYEDFLQKKSAGFTIVLKSFPTLNKLKGATLDEQRMANYKTLVKNAEETQAPLKKLLESVKAKYTALWINNAIYVEESSVNTLELVQKIAARSDVQEILSQRTEDLHFESAQGPFQPLSKKDA